ncbi:MAG: transposase, partial [Proteobacteria bacterium]
EWFDLPLSTVWSIFEDYLFLLHVGYNITIHSFVLMPNHIHLMISCPDANVSQALLYFLRESSKEITRLSGRINQTFGARNHKSLITTDHYFLNAYKYVYRNPIRAGLAKHVEDYEFSTMHGLLGGKKLIVPVAEDALLFSQKFDDRTFEWLNRAPNLDQEHEVRIALRKAEFCFAKSKDRKPSALETGLL